MTSAHGIESAFPGVAPFSTEPPSAMESIERAVAELGEQALGFARTPPIEKAALLRALLPRLLAVSSEMVALACRAKGIDPESYFAGELWLAGPVAMIANVRGLAESLEAIAARGRPEVPRRVRLGRSGRVEATIPSTIGATLLPGMEARVLFREGMSVDDVVSRQARFYRSEPAEGGVSTVVGGRDDASLGSAGALHELFVEGKTVLLHASPETAYLAPLMEHAFLPLIERGWLRLAHSRVTEPAYGAADAASVSPVVVVPHLYAEDELWFQARSFASQLANTGSLDDGSASVLVLSGCWPQKQLFLGMIEKALAAVPTRSAPDSGAATRDRERSVVTLGCDDPIAFLSAAIAFCNDTPHGIRGASIVSPPAYDDVPAIAAALDLAIATLHCRVVAVNTWPGMLRPLGIVPGTSMLEGVDKTVLAAALHATRKPPFFADNRQMRVIGERLAAYSAAPGVGARYRVALAAIRG